MEAWQDFGQKVDLTARIREILINYPEGTSILKELVQNADDARATSVRFCLDHRTFKSGSLLDGKLSAFQGPALYVYNDGVFNDKDFESISRIGDSKKKEQVGKTGRFGVGFNSIYHLTDLPSFVSGQHLVIFDPHCKYLPNVSATNPGKKINFVSHDVVNAHSDQAAPYQVFGCDMRHAYNGTFFRFPLRSAQQAAVSTISKQVYTPDQIHALFHLLQDELPLIMLFLKSVASIEVLEWHADDSQPTALFSCSVTNNTYQELRDQRALFLRAATAPAHEDVAGSYQLDLALRDNVADVSASRSFLISQCRGGADIITLADELSTQFQVPLVPWGAVAAEITAATAESQEASISTSEAAGGGLAYCFLPLPSRTGLPLHVNGYFELSSNRRDVWYGSDMSGAGARRAAWNEVLLREAVAGAYVGLLVKASQLLGHGSSFMRLWPQRTVAQPWQIVVEEMYAQASRLPLLWTPARGGLWLDANSVLFPDDSVLSNDALSSALVVLDVPLAGAEGRVLALMKQYMTGVSKAVTPAVARQAAAAHPSKCTTLQRTSQLPALLMYCLTDLDLLSQPPPVSQLVGLRLLPVKDGSLVAFTMNDATAAVAAVPVFVVSDALELLLVGSQGQHLLDDSLLGPSLTAQLTVVASYNLLNLQQLNVPSLINIFLPAMMPSHWRGLARVGYISGGNAAGGQRVVGVSDANAREAGGNAVTAEGDVPAFLSWEWIQGLWQWLTPRKEHLPLISTSGWPLLPLEGGLLTPLRPLSSSTVVLRPPDWPQELPPLFRKLGLHLLDTSSFELPEDDLLRQYVHPGDGRGVIAALGVALPPLSRQRSRGGNTSSNLGGDVSFDMSGIEGLTSAEKELLREYLLQGQWLNAAFPATGMSLRCMVQLLRQLPLYQLASSAWTVAHQTHDDDSHLQQQQQEDGADSATASATASAVMLVSLTADSCIAPEGVYHAVLDDSFITPATATQAHVMTHHMGVPAPSATAVYRQHVLPRLHALEPGLRDAAVLHLLHVLPTLMEQDTGFAAVLRQVAFIPNSEGTLHKPNQLYDPRNVDLVALLDPATRFPSSTFCSDDSAVAMLQQLGLRTTAGLDTVLDAARFVEQTADADVDMAVARGQALLMYLDAESHKIVGEYTPTTSGFNPSTPTRTGRTRQYNRVHSRPGQGLFSAVQGLLGGAAGGIAGVLGGRGGAQQEMPQPSGDSSDSASPDIKAQELARQELDRFWGEMRRIWWCPVLQDSPEEGLPWPEHSSRGNRGLLSAPRGARPMQDMWLASSVMDIVDGECRSSTLLRGLNWDAPLTGAVLSSQLLQLAAQNITVNAPARAQLLATVVPQLYGALSALTGEELESARAVLEGQPSVWVGNGFAAAERVAFKGSLDLSPYLYVLPLELAPFRDLLATLGAQEAFSGPQYAAMLSDLAQKSGGQPLSPPQLTQALAVSQALADVVGASGGGATSGGGAGGKTLGVLLIPDEEGILRPVGELAYNDAPWLDGSSGGTADATMHLVHPRISAPVAEALGVASRRRLLLAASVDTLALGLVSNAGSSIEAFGQSEALTTRLRHIIQDYPEGPGVLLELVQNADDAGARRVSFLLDTSQYGTSSVLGPAMTTWQGPALLSFNDAVFSPGDFAAIARIGQNGKMAQPAAIGRFGLGFNAVYHLTDMPSFVSGSHLVLFDPHAKYLPGASLAQPGLKIALGRGELLRQFPDAFTPYMHFGCSMKDHFNGTLFRFPLRTATAATASDIKPSPCGPESVMGLLEALQRVMPQALLFLKSVRVVEVMVLDANQQLHRVAIHHVGSNNPQQPPQAPFLPPQQTQQQHQQQQQQGVILPAPVNQSSTTMSSNGQVLSSLNAPSPPPPPASSSPSLWRMFRAELAPVSGGSESLQSPIMRFIAGTGGGSGSQQLDAFYQRLASAKPQDLPCTLGRVMLHLAVAGGDEKSEEWMVCNALAGGAARDFALKCWKDSHTKMMPWVGVAAALPSPPAAATAAVATSTPAQESDSLQGSPTSNTSEFPHDSQQQQQQMSQRSKAGAIDHAAAAHSEATGGGLAYCFLPLPSRTGLPLHVNGYFELSSNRRDVWYGSDMSGAGARRAAWNEALLREAVAGAYVTLMLEAASVMGPTESFFRLFPTETLSAPWNIVTQAFYKLITDKPLLWTPGKGGKWITPKQALLPDSACAANTQLTHLLVDSGVPLVQGLGVAVQKCLLEWTPGAAAITPSAARRRFRGSQPPALLRGRWESTTETQQGDATATADGSAAATATAVARQPPGAVLLDYCLSDIVPELKGEVAGVDKADQGSQLSADLLQQLQGLPLLPTADGTHRQLEHAVPKPPGHRAPSMHNTLTVVLPKDEVERQLLSPLSHCVIHPAVGPRLQQMLLQLADTGGLNISRVTAAAMDDYLLPQLLPPHWHNQLEVAWSQPTGATATTLSATATEPSIGFIRLLWQWLGDREDVAEVAHWPLLPLVGGCLRLLIQPAQVLKPGDWTDHLTSALTTLRCRLLDSNILGDVPCPSLIKFVQPPSAGGILDALVAAAMSGGNDARHAWWGKVKGLTAAERRHLRAFLLQTKWFTDGSLTAQQLHMLKCMPIYEVHHGGDGGTTAAVAAAARSPAGGSSNQVQPAGASTTGNATAAGSGVSTLTVDLSSSVQSFVALTGQLAGPLTVMLAPPGVGTQLLSSSFLRSDSEAEEVVLTQHLGVTRLTMTKWLHDYVAATAKEMDAPALHATLARVLLQLHELKQAEPELVETMGSLPLIPTPSGRLVAPVDLFNPKNVELAEMMDPLIHFPAPPFNGVGLGGDMILDALATCGMKSSVELQALLVCAKAVAAAAASGDGTATVTTRAKLLLSHLDQWATHHPRSAVAAISADDATADDALWLELQQVSWCPVLSTPPDPDLPWPHTPATPPTSSSSGSSHQAATTTSGTATASAFMPPRMVRPRADAWMVSAPLRLLDGAAGRELMGRLGWDVVPRASVLLAQLLELGRKYPAGQVTDTALQSKLQQATADLYRMLTPCLTDPSQAQLVEVSLPAAAAIWVGDGYCQGTLAALQPEEGAEGLRPLLFAVPHEFWQYSELLKLAGVRDRYTFQGYATALHKLAEQYGTNPLPDDSLALALQLCFSAAATITPPSNHLHQSQHPSSSIAPHHAGKSSHPHPQGGSSHVHHHHAAHGVNEELMLPDAQGVMAPAGQLYFNDASWLDAGGLRLVHEGLPQSVTEVLGVRSMRYQHEVSTQLTTKLPCPTLTDVRAALTDHHFTPLTVMLDLLELADLLRAEQMTLLIDTRQHGTQSLLHTGLARCQGPALCAVLHNPPHPLSSEELSQLLTAKPGYSLHGGRRATAGLGLRGAFAVSDVPQVLSGANTYMWDPSGHHLAQTAAEIRTPAPRARMYKHTESDLTERFADQYVPWDFIPDFSNDTLSTPLTCTAIRLPLRGPAEISSGSVISQDPVDVGLIKQELVKFCPLAGQSLLLTAHLTKAVVQVWEADADEPVTVWKCEAATASSSSTAVRPGCVPEMVLSSKAAAVTGGVPGRLRLLMNAGKLTHSRQADEFNPNRITLMEVTTTCDQQALMSLAAGESLAVAAVAESDRADNDAAAVTASADTTSYPDTSTSPTGTHAGAPAMTTATANADLDHAESLPELEVPAASAVAPSAHNRRLITGSSEQQHESMQYHPLTPSTSATATTAAAGAETGSLLGAAQQQQHRYSPNTDQWMQRLQLLQQQQPHARPQQRPADQLQHVSSQAHPATADIGPQQQSTAARHTRSTTGDSQQFSFDDLARRQFDELLGTPEPAVSPATSPGLERSTPSGTKHSRDAETDMQEARHSSDDISKARQVLQPAARRATALKQHWIVSSAVQEKPSALAAAAATALSVAPTSAGSSIRDASQVPFAAVAVCVSHSHDHRLQPASGLLSLVAVPPSTLSAPSTEPPPNSTSPPPSPSRPDYPTVTPAVSLLGCQSFLIAGHFHLSFTKGRRVPATVSALRQLVNGPGQTGQSSGQTSPSGSQSGAEHQQQRQVQWQQQMGNMFADLQHNDKVLQGVVTAWQAAVQYLCRASSSSSSGSSTGRPGTYPLHRYSLAVADDVYALMPDLKGAMHAGDGDAAYVFKQMYQAASSLRMWQLVNGNYALLQEGAFLQPMSHQLQQQQQQQAVAGTVAASPRGVGDGAGGGGAAAVELGPAAREFIQQHLPLFKAPWSVKEQLEAAGVRGLRAATPVVLRPLLRRLGERQPGANAEGGQHQPFRGMTVDQARELLEFCCSDLDMPSTHRSSAANTAYLAAGVNEATDQGGGNVPPNQEGNIAMADSGGVDAQRGSGGLDSALRGLGVQLQQGLEGLFSSVHQAISHAGAGQEQLQPAAPSPATVAGAAASSATSPRQPLRNPAQIRELRGLPIPTAGGTIAVIGALQYSRGSLQSLLVYPPEVELSEFPHSLFSSAEATSFIDIKCVRAISRHLKDRTVREELRISYHGLDMVAKDLQKTLADTWYPSPGGVKVVNYRALVVPWSDGNCGGPLPQWLLRMWSLAFKLVEQAPRWGFIEEPRPLAIHRDLLKFRALHFWPLIPLTNGALARVVDAGLVFVPPVEDLVSGPPADANEQQQEQQCDNGLWDPATLPAPWDWLLPALQQAGGLVLDARFPMLAPLTGPIPVVGQPPFLGPLICKLRLCALAREQAVKVESWSDGLRKKLFILLADNPPRDLEPVDVEFLQSLPIYNTLDITALLPRSAQHATAATASATAAASSRVDAHLPDITVDGDGSSSSSGSSSAINGVNRSSNPASSPRVVALNERTDWLLVPAGVIADVAGVISMLPVQDQNRLLEHQPNWGELYNIVRLTPSTLPQILSKLLIPQLMDLPEAGQSALLAFIQGQWSKLKSDRGLIDTLSGVPFVLAGDGVRRIAKELYDPHQPLFARVLTQISEPGSEPVFPAEPFSYPGWLQVLRDIGLQSSVTPATFYDLATHVAAKGAALGATATTTATATASGSSGLSGVLDAADALLQHLHNYHHGFGADRGFYQRLGQVAFVPATLGVPGGRSNRTVLASYSQLAVLKDWQLIWSTTPILDTGRLLPPTLASPLGLRSPPPFAAIQQHLLKVGADGGEELLSSWPTDTAGPIEDAFLHILTHLDKEGLSPEQAGSLSAAAFVPVGHGSRLMAPRRLFVKLGGAGLAPFAWELPAMFAGRLGVLKQLGVRDEPRAQDLVEALQEFGSQLNGARLNPNELQATLHLLGYLCSRTTGPDMVYLKTIRQAAGSTRAGSTGGRLLVPTADGRLVPAARAVHVTGGTGARLLGRTDPVHLTLVHPQLAEHVCRWLGLSSLQEAVMERLDPSQPVTSVSHLQSTPLTQIQALLASKYFHSAAYSFVAAYSNSLPALRRLTPRTVAVQLRTAAAKLVFVQQLHTQVVLRATAQDVTRDKDAARVYEYSDPDTGALYVAEPPEGLTLSSLLSQACSRLLGVPLTLPFHPLFTVHSPQQLRELQPVLLPGGYDRDLEVALQSGQVGSPLSISDRALLQLRPLKRYAAGELVAYQRSRPAATATVLAADERRAGWGNTTQLDVDTGGQGGNLQGRGGFGSNSGRYRPAGAVARIADTVRRSSSGGDVPESTRGAGLPSTDTAVTPVGAEGADSCGVVLCYGRVSSDCAPSPGQAAYRVTVETEPGVYDQLLSTQVFSFRSGIAPEPGTGTPSMGTAQDNAAGMYGAVSDSVESATAATASHSLSASGGTATGVTPTNLAPPAAGVEGLQNVGASELVGAVRDMLSAAGLPLDLDRTTLLQQALAAEQELRSARSALVELRASESAHESELESVRSSWQCRVCFTRDVDMAFLGCGHLFCSQCVASQRRCPMCRKESKTMKLYK